MMIKDGEFRSLKKQQYCILNSEIDFEFPVHSSDAQGLILSLEYGLFSHVYMHFLWILSHLSSSLKCADKVTA